MAAYVVLVYCETIAKTVLHLFETKWNVLNIFIRLFDFFYLCMKRLNAVYHVTKSTILRLHSLFDHSFIEIKMQTNEESLHKSAIFPFKLKTTCI